MKSRIRNGRRKAEQGFTMVDVTLAMTILLVGLMALSGAMTTAIMNTRRSQQVMKSKQIANSTLESIFSARDIYLSDKINNFDNIQNAPNGIFVSGERPVKTGAGPDGIIGTEDDNGDVVPGFKRTITITDVENPVRPTSDGWQITMRRINLTITYQDGGTTRNDTTVTYITDFSSTQYEEADDVGVDE